jgi:hypothetical protein
MPDPNHSCGDEELFRRLSGATIVGIGTPSESPLEGGGLVIDYCLPGETPRKENGHRPNKLHQWLTEDVGDPMLAQHLHSLMMFQRLAIANGYGWQRFLHMVDQVLPRRGDTLQLPFDDPNLDKEAAN